MKSYVFHLMFQMYITNTIKAKGTRLAKPVLCLGLMCLAFLTGLNRVAEYRNHWSDVIAGFLVGISIAVFLVSRNLFGFHCIFKEPSIIIYDNTSVNHRVCLNVVGQIIICTFEVIHFFLLPHLSCLKSNLEMKNI